MKKFAGKTLIIVLIAGMIAAAVPMAALGVVELSEDTDTATQSLTSEAPAAQEEAQTWAQPAAEDMNGDMPLNVFDESAAKGNGSAKIDCSQAHLGYVGVQAWESKRLKFQVIKGSKTYNYDLPGDGTTTFFPLQSGNGSYTLRVMKNVVDNKYTPLYSTTCNANLDDEFQPFIRPSIYVNYNADSACIAKAHELAESSETKLDFVAQVYKLITKSVRYDWNKAKTVQSGYVPVPDETLATGKGICFDYASLAASMLRSQGVPTKLIFGYVSPKGAYHAWNMFYTEETGWVTVSYEVTEDSWNRLDLTFSANGKSSDFIGDGGNYSDVYYY